MLAVGDIAPNFTLKNQDGKEVSLSDYRGKQLVLYFYPKDNTPACTNEAKDFMEAIDAFHKKGAMVVGISKDSVSSHTKFHCMLNLPFDLLSDDRLEVCQAYGIYQLKKLYGKESLGIVRTTYVINDQGIISAVFPKVRVKGHVNQVLEILA